MVNRKSLIKHIEKLIAENQKKREKAHAEAMKAYEKERKTWEAFLLKRCKENLKLAEAGRYREITNPRYACDSPDKPMKPGEIKTGNFRDSFLEMLRLGTEIEVKLSAKTASEYGL